MARGKQVHDNDELTAYYTDIYNQIEATTMEDPYGKYVFSRVKGGQKTIFNKTQTEIRNFDMSFLDVIESVYPAILKIMRDPKKSIRYEEEIVAVEKARKVNSQTVRHLSSHTQLIKEITKEGDVIPSKVLTTFAEEELAIYENRFLKSLVKRIEMFLERRYEVMKVSLESFENQRLNVTNEFLMSGQTVTVNLDISIKNDLTTDVKTTKEQYNRLLYVREMVQGLKGTEFMRALAKAKDVLPPIMKTNILLHNPDFKLCYGLWLYLDRVDGISTNVDVKEKTYKFSPSFDKDINNIMALAVTSFIKNREIEGIYASKNLPTVKAPKPQTNDNIQLELNFDADNKKLEDYTMNQILLDETAKFFEAAHEGIKGSSVTLNESIRVVYRQMLDMLDQIYPRTFGVSDEELETKNVYEQLEYARRRMMVFKIVRQQKQMNIARMGKEEKAIERTIAKIEEKVKVFEEQERLRLEKQRQKEEAARQAAIERERKEEERKRKLEDEALKRQKEIDKVLQATAAQTVEGDTPEEARKRQKAYELQLKNRNRLKEIKYYVPEPEVTEPEDEEVIYVDEEGNIIENYQAEEEVVYVDEEGNVIEGEEIIEEPIEEEYVPTEDDLMADEYEQMLRDSGLSDEEIALMLGDHETEAIEGEEEIIEDAIEPQETEEVQEVEEQPQIEETPVTEETPIEENMVIEEPQELEEVQEIEEPQEDLDISEYEQMLEESGLTEEELNSIIDEENPIEEALDENIDISSNEEETPVIEEENPELEEIVEEEIIYVDEDGNVIENYEEEVVYVDEDGNEINNELIEDDLSGLSEDELLILEYEKMLQESNMTPEEFEELVQLSGIPEIEQQEKKEREEEQDNLADEYEEMLRESGLTEEEIKALLGED